MNIKSIFLALLAPLAVAATAQADPVTPEAGGTYYIYNVGQKLYLADDGTGMLTLSATGAPMTVTLTDESNDDGIYFITSPSGKLGSSLLDAGVVTDGTGKYDHWRVSLVSGTEATYTIACRFRETAAFSYLYWGSIVGRLVKSALMPGFEYDNGHWQFISKEDYEKNLQVITLDEQAESYEAPVVTDTSIGATVHLKRTFSLNMWNSFSVPFAIDAAQLQAAFGDDVKLARFDSSTATTINFVTSTAVEAGKTYLVYPTKEQLDGGYYEFTGVTAFSGAPEQTQTTYCTSHPSYCKTTAPTGAYVIRKNVVYHLVSDMTMKGFRAYMTEADAAAGKITRWTLDGTTAITPVTAAQAEADAPVYNLAGQRVGDGAQKGVYIKNGKKIIIK